MINPKTGRKIKVGGPTYLNLVRSGKISSIKDPKNKESKFYRDVNFQTLTDFIWNLPKDLHEEIFMYCSPSSLDLFFDFSSLNPSLKSFLNFKMEKYDWNRVLLEERFLFRYLSNHVLPNYQPHYPNHEFRAIIGHVLCRYPKLFLPNVLYFLWSVENNSLYLTSQLLTLFSQLSSDSKDSDFGTLLRQNWTSSRKESEIGTNLKNLDSFRPEVPFCSKMLIDFVPNSESTKIGNRFNTEEYKVHLLYPIDTISLWIGASHGHELLVSWLRSIYNNNRFPTNTEYCENFADRYDPFNCFSFDKVDNELPMSMALGSSLNTIIDEMKQRNWIFTSTQNSLPVEKLEISDSLIEDINTHNKNLQEIEPKILDNTITNTKENETCVLGSVKKISKNNKNRNTLHKSSSKYIKNELNYIYQSIAQRGDIEMISYFRKFMKAGIRTRTHLLCGLALGGHLGLLTSFFELKRALPLQQRRNLTTPVNMMKPIMREMEPVEGLYHFPKRIAIFDDRCYLTILECLIINNHIELIAPFIHEYGLDDPYLSEKIMPPLKSINNFILNTASENGKLEIFKLYFNPPEEDFEDCLEYWDLASRMNHLSILQFLWDQVEDFKDNSASIYAGLAVALHYLTGPHDEIGSWIFEQYLKYQIKFGDEFMVKLIICAIESDNPEFLETLLIHRNNTQKDPDELVSLKPDFWLRITCNQSYRLLPILYKYHLIF